MYKDFIVETLLREKREGAELAELSEGNASLTPSEGKREGRLGGNILACRAAKKGQQGYQGTSRQSQLSEESQAFQEQVGLSIPLCPAIGWRNLWDTWPWHKLGSGFHSTLIGQIAQ